VERGRGRGLKKLWKSTLFPLFALLLLLPACNDYYSDYYYESGDSDQDKLPSLLELIQAEENLSIFTGMLQMTGYDLVLAGDQTYTVFAPLNEALAAVNLSDTLAVRNIVKTHIARFSFPAMQIPGNYYASTKVTMVNSKLISFFVQGDQATIGEQELALKNERAKNGILHTLKGAIPFLPNLWEALQREEMDSIRNYLYPFNIKQFNRSNSTIIDYTNGYPVYDSVFYESNIMFNTSVFARGIGALNTEDSIYSMILPTNKAWAEAYGRMKDYFVSEDDSLQHANTQYAIIKNLVFRGRYYPENAIPGDTLFSTRYIPFTDPVPLFEGSQRYEFSNGLAYQTDLLHYKPWDSWQREIKVEAEWGIRGDALNTVGPFFRYTNDTLISNHIYLSVLPQNSSQGPVVYFTIPETLSACYNIYAVFVPECFEYPTDTLGQARIQYQVQQLDRSTIEKQPDQQIWKHILSGGESGSDKEYKSPPQALTDVKNVTKMLLVENFKFPLANIGELQSTIRIAITNHRLRSDSKQNFQYRMFIDYILLEPVKN
jgi:uncharacterized surface protein with fasciclin (FAS1) repeats